MEPPVPRASNGTAAGQLAVAALLWGFAEATLFFIVPDVLLSFVTQRRGLRAGLAASGFAVLGACLGGAIMWQLGAAYPATVAAMLDRVPAISPSMIDRARTDLAAAPLDALVAGSFSGVPYKVYAGTAASAGVGPANLLLDTIPARALRFALVAAITTMLTRASAPWIGRAWRERALIGFWIVFYLAYWWLTPN